MSSCPLERALPLAPWPRRRRSRSWCCHQTGCLIGADFRSRHARRERPSGAGRARWRPYCPARRRENWKETPQLGTGAPRPSAGPSPIGNVRFSVLTNGTTAAAPSASTEIASTMILVLGLQALKNNTHIAMLPKSASVSKARIAQSRRRKVKGRRFRRFSTPVLALGVIDSSTVIEPWVRIWMEQSRLLRWRNRTHPQTQGMDCSVS